MGQNTVTLTPRQSRCIDALMHAKTVQDAALDARISRSTLYRWLELPEFVQALRVARSQALDHATRRLSDSAAGAVDTLIALSNRADKDSVRVTACIALLSHGLTYASQTELEERISRLEGKR